MKWYRVTTPKNIERMKEFDLPIRWYVDEMKTAELFKDTDLLWQIKEYISGGRVAFARMYADPEEVAEATENWSNAVVIAGKRYIAKTCVIEKAAKIAITKL